MPRGKMIYISEQAHRRLKLLAARRSRPMGRVVEELRPVLLRRGARQEAALIGSTDRWYYEKVLPDGRLLRTKVSRALHREIPGHL